MIKIVCEPDKVRSIAADKRLFLFGAGRATGKCVDFCNSEDIRIEAIIDTFFYKYPSGYTYENVNYDVFGIAYFLDLIKESKEECLLFITSVIYSNQIISQLNNIHSLDCLKYISFRDLSDVRVTCSFDFTNSEQHIPKTIHYCWFGGGQMSPLIEKCLYSWSKFANDYTITRWDETNYNVSENEYIRTAYENKQWAFVSDYARLDVLEQYGGLYFDVDVELISSPSVLLNDEAFFCMRGNFIIATGVGCGAVAHHPIIRDLMSEYEAAKFVNEDGSLNRKANNVYNLPVFKSYGFKVKNEYQKKSGIVIYPSEVLSPIGAFGTANFFSEKTIGIHHGTKSWLTEKELAELKRKP